MATKRRIRCNQCEALMINGVFCHETGCPNTRSRYDEDTQTWVKQRECFECGCTVNADDPCCSGDNQDEWLDEETREDEQGSALTPVIAILTAFTIAAVLIAQSGLLRAVLARLAEVR